MFHGGLTDRHKKMEVKRMSIFDQAKFEEREHEVREYMRNRGVRLSEMAAECGVHRTTAARQLKTVHCVSDMIRIIDRIAERKAERREWKAA